MNNFMCTSTGMIRPNYLQLLRQMINVHLKPEFNLLGCRPMTGQWDVVVCPVRAWTAKIIDGDCPEVRDSQVTASVFEENLTGDDIKDRTRIAMEEIQYDAQKEGRRLIDHDEAVALWLASTGVPESAITPSDSRQESHGET